MDPLQHATEAADLHEWEMSLRLARMSSPFSRILRMRLASLSVLPLTECGGSQVNDPDHGESPLTVASPDLTGGTFPREFTCDGANRRPRLEWSTPPPDTQELAIELLDPDAPGGTFTHWLVYGIPSGVSSLATVPADAAEGVNDFGRRGYGGPCPPRGAAHHYHFVVLALDTRLGLAAGATRPVLESRIRGHVLGKGELVATYQRG